MLLKARRFIPLLVVAAGLLAYHNSFTGGFFLDDVGAILKNPTIRHLWPIWQPLSPPHQVSPTSALPVQGRPLINLSLAINCALGGYNVWGYHAVNLSVHVLGGLTLLGIVRRTLLQPPLRNRFGAAANELALATAVLWTVHPLQTESVTYIIQRAESIMGLFYLLTLYCFIRGVESERARLWYGLSVTACALGMASKEVMVSAPLMVLLYDRAFLSESFRKAWCRRRPLYLALASTWIVLGFVLASGASFATVSRNARHAGVTWWENLATEPGAILYYLRLFVWPSPLRLLHEWPIARTWISILPPAVVVVTLVGASAWAWRTNPVWGFVGAWFFLILAPSSSFIPLFDPVCEHRLYLSLAAPVSLVVIGLYSLAGRRSLVGIAAVAIGLGFLTWRRNQDYSVNPQYSLGVGLAQAGRLQEAIGHFEQVLRTAPDDAWLHYNFGVALMGLARLQEAIEHYEQALRLNPDFAEAHNNLAIALEEAGRVPEAIGHWEEALRIKPDYAEAHSNLGLALGRAGRIQEALEHYERALRIWPDYAEAHYNMAAALQQVGKVPEAMMHYEQALRINPDFTEAHYNFGVTLARLGRVQEALGHFEQAVRIKPDFAEAHNNLGIALEQVGRVPGAIEHWEQALRLKPDYAEAHSNLGVALGRAGRIQEAIKHFEQALLIRPEDADAHYNLGVALEQLGRAQEANGHYKQALRIKPDFAEARNRLARLRNAQ